MRLPFVSRIWFRPRILVDVTKVDWSTKILGYKSSMPVYIVSIQPRIWCEQKQTISQTATALGKLGHPDGELNLTRAAAKHGVIQMVMNFHVSKINHLTDVNRYLRWRLAPSTNWWTLPYQAKYNFCSCENLPPICAVHFPIMYI